MDIDQTLAHARARFDHAAARKTLREKYQAKLNFAWHGGMFRASPELVVFLSLYDDQDIVILDNYENPVRVNARELGQHMRSRLQEQMNAWLVEFESLNQQR
jgi:hypothetical protein